MQTERDRLIKALIISSNALNQAQAALENGRKLDIFQVAQAACYSFNALQEVLGDNGEVSEAIDAEQVRSLNDEDRNW